MSKGVALVTGSGSARGIGRAISLRLADDGFDVAVTDIPTNQRNLETLVEEIKAKGRKSCSILADVTQEEQVKMMVETVVRDLGGLDVVRSLHDFRSSSLKCLISSPQDDCKRWGMPKR